MLSTDRALQRAAQPKRCCAQRCNCHRRAHHHSALPLLCIARQCVATRCLRITMPSAPARSLARRCVASPSRHSAQLCSAQRYHRTTASPCCTKPLQHAALRCMTFASRCRARPCSALHSHCRTLQDRAQRGKHCHCCAGLSPTQLCNAIAVQCPTMQCHCCAGRGHASLLLCFTQATQARAS